MTRTTSAWTIAVACGASLALVLWLCTVYLFTPDGGSLEELDTLQGTLPLDLASTAETHSTNRPALLRCGSGYVLNTSGAAAICSPCPRGTFSYPGWLRCQSWLTCDDLAGGGVRVHRYLSSGAVKHVFLASIVHGALPVAYAVSAEHRDDFRHHIDVLRALAPSSSVVQLLGECQDQHVVTQYWKLGHAAGLDATLARREYAAFDTAGVRYGLAMDYVAALLTMHGHGYVMCDGNDIAKLLSQFLITDDWRLVANDLDAAAEVVSHANGTRRLIKCGHRRLHGGDLIAPEQMWPFGDEPFDDSRMPGYDEKIDIWRIPPMVRALLGTTADHGALLSQLANMFARCRHRVPRMRPSASEVWEEMRALKRSLDLSRPFEAGC